MLEVTVVTDASIGHEAQTSGAGTAEALRVGQAQVAAAPVSLPAPVYTCGGGGGRSTSCVNVIS